MAEQQEDLDRNEEATPHKLRQARERGQVARSADIVSASVFTVAVALLYWKGWDALQAQFRYDHALLAQAGRIDASAGTFEALLAQLLRDTGAALAPLFAALALAAIVANFAQTGSVLSLEPVKADLARLHPVNGLKKLFSPRTLFDGARAVVKLVLLSLVVYLAIKALVPQFPRLAGMPPALLARTIVGDAASAGLKIALALLVIACFDFAWSRREFARRMRMSRRELKDEHKQREGDPRIRARLRELRREALRRSMALRRTAQADVLLTNPTHVAVALRYDESAMSAPQVVAKGAGALAAVMRQLAARHRIPVVQSPPLARELFHELEVDQYVPPALYADVARILVWVFAMRNRRAGSAA
ncbi:MAG TPA: EscU/YscU/HrcU family type III secretion system export apparatus switch protein [Ramlibacter sp.]|uniref:EscU/YscU/HrcU family type III secretion system export apparatus switch protein n=1 Tax=Ramlibacter sp. TaxID=1917967 RepID=UPI002CD69C17|nr:EscU/YscU/HrcU family type III secretion system export apparatus switch protein [Ramlibacter sp.]HVZ46133.1 EscU/YscU/HrcU family type III secretion system export apparatus switch protein [Ramlibacter sp.]